MLFVENKISSINKEVSMARTLGAWDCEYCDTKRIWGNIFDCPGCGKPRSRGVRFYIVDNAPPVTSEIAKVLGSGGPNWYCGHCESGNKDDVTKCWNCGAEKGSSPSHEVKSYSQDAGLLRKVRKSEMIILQSLGGFFIRNSKPLVKNILI